MRVVFSLFPKYFKDLDPRELAALAREMKLDTVNMVVREGYWVAPENLAAQAPAFVKAMDQQGIRVKFATTGFSAEQLIEDDTPLKVLADCGVTQFRMGYFRSEGKDIREQLQRARAQMAALAQICEKNGIRAVYQLHQKTLISSPSAAWMVFQGLPSQWVGVEIDPGNQNFEGLEACNRTAHLLDEYIVAVGVKDSAPERDRTQVYSRSKGWDRKWVPLYEGETDWYELIDALKEIDFHGTMVFMPFYNKNEPDLLKDKLRLEVEYLIEILDNATDYDWRI